MKPTNLIKNILGPIIKRKLLAIFVDDFGSIRVKDRIVSKKLIDSGIPNNIYLRDTLASEQDLHAIFDMLRSVRDYKNHYACFTPFSIMANPDFESIKKSGYKEYYRESFVDTLKKYGKGYDHAFDLWKEGASEGLFVPAFHGTEHLNVRKWLKALQSGHKSTLLAFENESICIPPFKGESRIEGIVEACDIEKRSELKYLIKDLEEGTKLFRKIFCEEPLLFTPGAATYSPLMEKDLYRFGIKYIDVPRRKLQPLGDNQFVTPFHYLGQKNKIGQHYIVRNCAFEPVKLGDSAISSCLDQVSSAFFMCKPAIISTHRLNYIGHFEERNRTDNLKRLKILLTQIINRWPDVEFISGKDLCKIYK